jgi:hypothetical protein
MRLSKLAVCTLVLCCSAFLVGVGSANAQTGITLTANKSQSVNFTGMGKNTDSNPVAGSEVGITLGTCFKGECTEKGTGSGTGAFASSGAFTLTSGQGSIIATLVNATLGTWSVSETAPIVFDYGTKGSLLSGDLNLLSFMQSPKTKSGTFDWSGQADLTITGGSLASAFTSSGGILEVNVLFGSTKNITTLLGTTTSTRGTFTGGQLTPTPEPSAFAIFLLGSGMLLIGGLLRRRTSQTSA